MVGRQVANLPTGKALGGFFGNVGSAAKGALTEAGNVSKFLGFNQPLDASRTYSWDMPDLPEILWDVNQAGPDWNKSPGGAKILSDLGTDPTYRNRMAQMELYRDPKGSLPAADQSLVTTDDIDRLSSRMMGGGFYGGGRQGLSLAENLWESVTKGETEDLKNWGRGFLGRYQDHSPFEIMYAGEVPTDTFARSPLSGYRVDDQTIIPQFDLTPDLDIPFAPITFPEGTVPPFQGPVDWDFTPDREDWFPNESDAFTVQDDAEASLYPIGFTTGSLLEEPSTENLNAILMNTIVPMEGITETVETLPSGPEGMIEVVDIPEAVSSLPSGPEEMTEVFTEEDKAAEDERKRIAEIAAQAERDQFELERKAERLEWESRREQERAEEDARKKREEAAKAQDRQDKARLAREADERERQAQERQRELEDERRQAVEAARLNELARAAEQQNLANQRRQREEEARKQAEFDRQHEAFIKQMDRDWRARQQASMPKSWAFF
jgi:hypothetical protein